MAICRFYLLIVYVHNFENIKARKIKYLPLDSAYNFDKDSIKKELLLGKITKKLMIYDVSSDL